MMPCALLLNTFCFNIQRITTVFTIHLIIVVLNFPIHYRRFLSIAFIMYHIGVCFQCRIP